MRCEAHDEEVERIERSAKIGRRHGLELYGSCLAECTCPCTEPRQTHTASGQGSDHTLPLNITTCSGQRVQFGAQSIGVAYKLFDRRLRLLPQWQRGG
jgi:hypothetical protein